MEVHSVWSFKKIAGFLLCTLSTLLWLSDIAEGSGCVFQPDQCPSTCRCSSDTNTLNVNCSSSGLQSWPENLPMCSAIYLDVSRNKLKILEYKSYMNVTITIDASHNSITSINKYFGRPNAVPSLKHLYLQNNDLTSLSKKEVNFMKKLTMTSLHNNHWDCRCNLSQFHTWVEDSPTNLMNRDLIKCFKPRSLQGRAIGELDDEDICEENDWPRIPIWIPIVITVACLVYLAVISAIAMCIVLRRRVKVIDRSKD